MLHAKLRVILQVKKLVDFYELLIFVLSQRKISLKVQFSYFYIAVSGAFANEKLLLPFQKSVPPPPPHPPTHTMYFHGISYVKFLLKFGISLMYCLKADKIDTIYLI